MPFLDNLPVYRKSEPADLRAEQAFEVYSALARTEALNPALDANAYWRAIRDDMREKFLIAFDEIGDA